MKKTRWFPAVLARADEGGEMTDENMTPMRYAFHEALKDRTLGLGPDYPYPGCLSINQYCMYEDHTVQGAWHAWEVAYVAGMRGRQK